MILLTKRVRRSFKESLKTLEADIQHANTLAAEIPKEFGGACLQLRISYSPVASLFLFLVRWTNCSLAGALGLLRILIYKDGTTTMLTHERKASLREFYAFIYPSLQQLQGGITELEDKRQRAVCLERFKKKADEDNCFDLDIERDQECGICMEVNTKIALPDCSHAMCIKCYRAWNARSQSCPFCRDSLKRVNSGDLWIFTDSSDVEDMVTLAKDNLQRLFLYIDKLPLLISDNSFAIYGAHVN
ncbi:hypothetical protein O6H91_02G080900 [Diphasiastrum complanatum]|uniref:Uncharacterized protein n=1 Tax=Diphasiastrum complanatum TaxID=34168 RepID=A0ACC2EHD6_DIPCM|nr:hypothetical protein O6H91_02G080900 [Diphasiastrum complanatum]